MIPEETMFCCFSGHRRLPAEIVPTLRLRLREEILSASERGYCGFISGGAMGFDMIAADEVLKLRDLNPKLSLTLALPYRGQAERFPFRLREEYERIRVEADEVIFTSEEYNKFCMQKRNRFMVDRSTLCICYLTELSGGTASTAAYALSCGKELINLANRMV